MKSTIAQTNEEEMLKILSEQAPVGVCIMQDGKFCYVNANFPLAIGYTVDELLGKDSSEIVFPEDSDMVRENTIKMLKGELTLPYQFRVIHKNGSIVWVMATVKSIEYHGRRATLGNYMEITGRKQLEETLKEREERYRELANSITDVFFAMDDRLRYTYWNKASEILTGIPAEDALGKCLPEIFPDTPGIKRAEKTYRSVLRTQQPQTFVNDHIDRDGRHYIFEISAYPSRAGISVFVRDITERKRAEESLQQSEEKYRALFDSSGIGMFAMDAETMRIVICNQAAARMFGFSSTEEAIGVNPLDFILPEDKDKAFEITTKEMFEQDLRRTHEYRVVNKDGREGWASVTGARIMHEGRSAGLVSLTDITERKQAVEALRQSEERYRTMLEEMEDAYFEVDLGGHLTFVNNSVCRDLGYSKEELMGMSYKNFTTEDDIESVFGVFNEVYRTNMPNKGFSWKTTRKDRSHGFAETSVSPMRNNKGEIIGFSGVGRDVTERKQTEAALRQSEENYRALFDSAVIGAFVIDAETMKVVIANQAALEVFGFSSLEEVIGVDPLDFVHPDDRERVFKIITKDMFEQDLRQTNELRAITKDGKEIWISATGSRITHAGRLAGLISFTEITERKQTEAALRQSEENYRALFDSAVIGMIVVDTETVTIVMANQVAAKIFGFNSVDEIIGVDALDFAPPEDKEIVLEIARKALFEDTLRQTHEFRAITKDGREIWTSITGVRISHKGRLAALISFTDITERKQAEEALKQSEQNYRALFDSAVIGTIVLDAKTMKVVIANQAAAKIFGFSSVEEVLEVDPLDFIRPEDKARISELAEKALFEQDSQLIYELGVVTKDGRKIWISATGARIIHEGRLAGLISFTDITEKRQQNERLIMADRLASIGELAAGTAHELNNPLTSVIGFAELLMEKDTPDYIRRDLAFIKSEAQRAITVTSNLLTFARKYAPEKRLNQINEIIEDILQLRAYAHKSNGIDIERHLAPNLPEIMVDYFQMQQVFLNIIINAEYFMTEAHKMGTLTITTKKQNNTVRISLADDGPGIPPENLSHIFDPFFTTKEPGKGTGLGLSICHGIVAEHGGQIYAKSEPGKGATIFVELPINGNDHIRSVP